MICFQKLTQNLTEELRNPTKNVGYVSLSPSRDVNLRLSEYTTGMLTLTAQLGEGRKEERKKYKIARNFETSAKHIPIPRGRGPQTGLSAVVQPCLKVVKPDVSQ